MNKHCSICTRKTNSENMYNDNGKYFCQNCVVISTCINCKRDTWIDKYTFTDMEGPVVCDTCYEEPNKKIDFVEQYSLFTRLITYIIIGTIFFVFIDKFDIYDVPFGEFSGAMFIFIGLVLTSILIRLYNLLV